jgi:hypothetical protein
MTFGKSGSLYIVNASEIIPVGEAVGISDGVIDGAIVGWTVVVVEMTNETQWSVRNIYIETQNYTLLGTYR